MSPDTHTSQINRLPNVLQSLNGPAPEANSLQAVATRMADQASALLCSAALQGRLPHPTREVTLGLLADQNTFVLIQPDWTCPAGAVLPIMSFAPLGDPNPESELVVRVPDPEGMFVGGPTGAGKFAWDRVDNPNAPDWKTLNWSRFRLEPKPTEEAVQWLRSETFRFRLWTHFVATLERGRYQNLVNELTYAGLLSFLQEASDSAITALGGKKALQEALTAKARTRIQNVRVGLRQA